MVNRKTNRGKPIDMDALRSASSRSSKALGNMGVNALGDELGPGGEIIKKREQRVRDFYANNPKSSTSKASLKGEMPSSKKIQPDGLTPEVKTAKTAAENKRTEVTAEDVQKRTQEIKEEMVKPIEQDIAPLPIDEPEEFDAPEGTEPLGFREVELPNGDIEMVPYYREDDEE